MFSRLFSRKTGLFNIKIFKFVSIIIVLIVLCYFINIEIKSKKEQAGIYLTSESRDINQAIPLSTFYVNNEQRGGGGCTLFVPLKVLAY